MLIIIMITIEINSQRIEKQLMAVAIATQRRTPVMRQIAGAMHAAVMANFQQGGRPKWLGLKYRQGVPLNDTGALRKSINEYFTNDMAAVGTNLPYAAIHHFGGTTKPHIIKPVTAKALYFNGRFAKSVNHPGSKIPARPFLILTEDDKDEIIYLVQKYLQSVIN